MKFIDPTSATYMQVEWSIFLLLDAGVALISTYVPTLVLDIKKSNTFLFR
jgi:hypothetical protein